MLKLKYLLLLHLVLTMSCGTQNTGSTSYPDKLNSLITKKLGKEASQENNFDKTFVLAWSEDNRSGTPIIRYGVWVIATGELKYAGTAIRGNVKWLDNTSLLVEDYPGIDDGDNQEYKYKIDVNTKIKTPLHGKKDL